jgi:hypothetical protein
LALACRTDQRASLGHPEAVFGALFVGVFEIGSGIVAFARRPGLHTVLNVAFLQPDTHTDHILPRRRMPSAFFDYQLNDSLRGLFNRVIPIANIDQRLAIKGLQFFLYASWH